jgi:hypothetical protein
MGFKCFHTSCAGRRWQDAKRQIGKPAGDHYDPPMIKAKIKGGQQDDATARAAGETQAKPKSMPDVVIGTEEYRVADECLPGLALDPDLFQRGGEFVTVREDEDTNCPVIVPVVLPDLRRRVTRQVRLFTVKVIKDSKEFVPAHPPDWLAKQLNAHPTKAGIRHLSGLSGVPVLRPDGTIHDRAGYDAETEVVYVPGTLTVQPLPARLTRDDAVRAADELLDLVRDFPIGDPAGRSVFLSFLLSALARHLFDGGVPLHLVDANVRGSGKGLILDVAGVIVLGGPVPVQQYTPDPAELRKVITSGVRAGKTILHLDNLPSGEPFGNAALDSALTCSVWEDRLLGQNLTVAYPHEIVWAASGNNVDLSPWIASRVRVILCHFFEGERHEAVPVLGRADRQQAASC